MIKNALEEVTAKIKVIITPTNNSLLLLLIVIKHSHITSQVKPTQT
jgi:hypothetical protein